MKNIFITIKKRWIFCFVFFVVVSFLLLIFVPVKKTSAPPTRYTVVIDAGHGGLDGGSVGVSTGVVESDLNLSYALNLAKQLKQMNIGVVLTRVNSEGLYDQNSINHKRSEMKKRKQIIDESDADIVVSIHMNSFRNQSSKGAMTFYNKQNERGENLANCIQSQLSNQLENAKKQAHSGDYYITNCTSLPAVIVECGFLSNPDEEKLLQTKEYENKVCYAILCGILSYMDIEL